MENDLLTSITFITNYIDTDREKAKREEERYKLIRELYEEIRQEKLNSVRKVKEEAEAMKLRKEQLQVTWYVLYDNNRAFMDYQLSNKDVDSWDQYMRCDGLPDPGIVSDLNTYLFLWSLDDYTANVETVAKKSEEVIYLLNKLESIIHYSVMNPREYIDECISIRQQFRDKLQMWLDLATYRLLRRIEQGMIREDLRNARFVKKSKQLICCLWALIKLPISIKQVTERDRKPVEVVFDEINLTIKMPMDVDCYCMAIRGMWVKYDHYSDQTASFNEPELPEKYRGTLDLLNYCQIEHETKAKIREEQAEGRRLRLEEKRLMAEKLANPPPTASQAEQKKAKSQAGQYGRGKKNEPEPEPEPEPLPYLPTPDEIILANEGEVRKEIRRLLFTRCEKTELNLRKYTILGGAIHVDLVYQPAQPKDMRRDILITALQIPKELKYVPFMKPYDPPPPAAQDAERPPEVIEAEMKALEEAMEALALVTLKIPDTVLWFEPPLVAHWLPERKIWSTKDVHDIKYNEEQQIITFRTGRLGVHGLAGYRYINLPFQSWEMKPESGKENGGGVILSITAAIVQVEFIVREDLVCLRSLVGGTSSALQEIVGEYMKLHFLIQKMRAGGCDLFPDQDARSYMKGLSGKHPVVEKHLQSCMGLLCTAYLFGWSRWNAGCTPREIVIQFKEIHGCVAQQSNSTLLVSPLETCLVDCTEVSTEFSNKRLPDQENQFHADLYHMAMHNAGIKSRMLMKSVSFKLATIVTQLLQRTSVISMSS
ncbi:dynein axonemal intermediate chain 7-like isoform X1 [Neodiprion lecontei]|uniref:Dynein axonemal intermediate chain 7-like isoform X1 n=1 Tax=Neodiprion lecontei TaxID=441921 RepID=A0A6J0BCZ9_NEOLC|nr:dynein axonemal intermediate chain 7-like isoform X1 [Neodiprion lecontei]